MKCTLPGRHIKLFGKSVHCLSKIGEELYIEGLQNGLTIRTVNSSRSAYGCFHFDESFFVEYSSGVQEQEADTHSIKVKIAMKSCLGVFKSLSNLEKIVDFCKIEYDEPESRLVFTLSCKHGIVKTHNLTFQECESLQAIFSKELCQNMIRSSARVFQDCVANFPGQCEEISLCVSPQHIKFKNFVEDESELSKVVHTEMTLSPEEFEDCRIGIDTEITFCLKELRAILGFSEAVNQPLNVHFETGGRPVSFSMDGDNTFTADFVLASLIDAPPDSQMTQASQANTNTGGWANERQKNRNPPNEQQTHISTRKKGPSGNGNRATSDMNNGFPKTTEQKTKRENVQSSKVAIDVDEEEVDQEKQTERQQVPPPDDFFTDSFPYKDMFSSNTAGEKQHQEDNEPKQNQSFLASSGRSVRPLSTPRSSQTGPNVSKVSLPKLGDSCPLEDSFYDAQDNENIPGTPPAKRHRSMLFGAESEQLQEEQQMVLAADTDEED